MKRFILIGLFAALIAVGVLASCQPQQRTALDYERDQLALDQARATAPAWIVGEWIVVVGGALLIIGIPAALVVAAAARFRRSQQLVKPDAAGRLPLVFADAGAYQSAAVAALADFHATERQRASIAPVPHSLSYAPHTTYSPHTASTSTGGSAALTAGPAVLDAPALALPDSAPLAEYLSQARPHRLLFGIAPDGKLLQAPMAASYHMLMQGKTRSGKSNLLNLLLVQLHYQQRTYGLHTAIYIGDFKREISSIWRRSSLVSLSTTEPSEIAELLNEMVHGPDGVLARQDFFDQEGRRRGRVINNLLAYETVTGATLPRHYIVLDEINALLTAADDKRLSDELAKLLFTGAGAGYFVLGGAHGLDAKTFDRIGREQFVTRMQFGAFDQSTVNLLFGSMKIDAADVDLLDGRGGRGLIQTVAMARPTPFQALQVEEADILPYIDQRPDEATAATMRQLADNAETIIAAPSAGDAPISDVVRRAVWQRKRQGMTKAETIKGLWGASKGASEGYRAASALYDRVIADGPPAGE
jgi:hypothetical protein